MKKIISILTLIITLFVSSLSSTVYARTGIEKTPFNGITIAECAGSCDGYCGNNSKQALEESIDAGYKTIEVDLTLTSDGKIVCANGWNKKTYEALGLKYNKDKSIMSYNDFMNAKIKDQYTTIDGDTFHSYVEEYGDIRWIVDFGDLDDYGTDTTMRAFKKVFEFYTDRITMKIYNYNVFIWINSLFDFSNYMYVIDSKEDVEDIDNILTFCSDKNFMSIQIKNSLITKNIVNKCHEYGLQVVSTTTNSEKKAKKLLALGVDCIATNTISPDFGETTGK